MVSQEYQSLWAQIQQHFAYLFDRHNFTVLHTEDVCNGSRCLIILTSPDCRIRFHSCLGHRNMMFGPHTAPLDWADVLQGIRHWYYATEILNYVQQTPVDIEQVLAQVRSRRSPEQQMADLARRLEPLCATVIALFRPGVHGEWDAAYERHKAERAVEFNRQVRAWEARRRAS